VLEYSILIPRGTKKKSSGTSLRWKRRGVHFMVTLGARRFVVGRVESIDFVDE
jgi:hypothetical protein